ncbi:MAG: oligopeptide transport system ATP-binding protein [Modestobacter sp.]|nr:oligopeptide transport system ATP-binding protein [Modestobacter sp.]
MSTPGTAPAGGATPLLQVTDLTKHFGGRRRRGRGAEEAVKAVDGVSLTVGRGETLGLVGESGSGKSTTGYCILRLLDASSGTIHFEGQDITHLTGSRLRGLRRRMQVIFQDPLASHNPRMSVGDIIAEPLVVHGIGDAAGRAAEARRLLDLVGLPSSAMERRPHEFSGGQCQRISIARALALKPSLIICDEPVSALDVSVQAQVLNLLKDLQDELGLAYLFIAHDLAVVRSISDRIAVMQGGRIVEAGPADQVYDSPQHEYTRRLLAAAPVADPTVMRRRRLERQAAVAR